jgi:pyridoxal phosphate enzyme (YggS family)
LSAGGKIAAQLESLRQRIQAAAQRAGRDPAEVQLVGAAKTNSAEQVAAAVRAGLRHVGENYVQEAGAKITAVRALLASDGTPLPRWHFIGHLQRNKARVVAPIFDLVETIDSERLGSELDKRAGVAGRSLETLLQVDVDDEPGKGGVLPDALPGLLAASASWANLRVTGLMAIPAARQNPEDSRPAFARVRLLRDSLREMPGGAHLRELSMGMSGDFEIAIEEGATLVRVGTALFGARKG